MTPLQPPWNRRRPNRRAVSPIIAMILLVAIVVVLAAVLYVLVGNLGHGSDSVPLGTALYAGPAHDAIVGSSATSSYCQKNHYCYAVPIDEVGGGLALSNLNFQITDATGKVHIVSANSAQIALTNLGGTLLVSTKVSKNAAFVVTSWQTVAKGVTTAMPLSDQVTIWVQFGNTNSNPSGTGETLNILGVDGFAGEISIALP